MLSYNDKNNMGLFKPRLLSFSNLSLPNTILLMLEFTKLPIWHLWKTQADVASRIRLQVSVSQYICILVSLISFIDLASWNNEYRCRVLPQKEKGNSKSLTSAKADAPLFGNAAVHTPAMTTSAPAICKMCKNWFKFNSNLAWLSTVFGVSHSGRNKGLCHQHYPLVWASDAWLIYFSATSSMFES